jgi:hypothetical protein
MGDSESGIGNSDPNSNTKKNEAGRFRYNSENDIAGSDFKLEINAETSDLHPSVMCTSKSENGHQLFSFLFCPKYFISCTAKLERETNILLKIQLIKTAAKK